VRAHHQNLVVRLSAFDEKLEQRKEVRLDLDDPSSPRFRAIFLFAVLHLTRDRDLHRVKVDVVHAQRAELPLPHRGIGCDGVDVPAFEWNAFGAGTRKKLDHFVWPKKRLLLLGSVVGPGDTFGRILFEQILWLNQTIVNAFCRGVNPGLGRIGLRRHERKRRGAVLPSQRR